MKTINEVIEELPPPEDPIESMELDEPQSSTTLTYTQIIKDNNQSTTNTPPKPQKKHLKCVNGGRDTKDNHKKSSMTKVNINEFTLLCEKCTMMKEIRNDTEHPEQSNNVKFVKYTLIIMNPEQEEILYVEAYV